MTWDMEDHGAMTEMRKGGLLGAQEVRAKAAETGRGGQSGSLS